MDALFTLINTEISFAVVLHSGNLNPNKLHNSDRAPKCHVMHASKQERRPGRGRENAMDVDSSLCNVQQ